MSKYFKAYNAVKNLIKGGNTSPTISSVKPSIHKTKKAQKTSEMKIQFNKQKNRTISDKKMGKKEPTLTEYANRKLTTRERNEASKKMFDDANGRTKKAEGGAITPRDINKNGKTDDFERARAKGMAKGMGRQFRDSKADGGKATHKTKDGRTVKKGLYYYMNRAKKRGTSKPGKGSVTDKALSQSAKTAKKD